MAIEDTIKRINELYHKSKNEGLTEAEKEEQQALRKEYIENVRRNIRGQLEGMTVQRPDGTVEEVKNYKK